MSRDHYPANTEFFKVKNKKKTRRRCEIYSKLTIETPERRHQLWTYFTPFPSVSIVYFELVNLAG